MNIKRIVKYLLTIMGCWLFAISVKAQETDRYSLDQTYSIDPNGTIELQSDDADVRIVGSDREDVHLVVRYVLEVRGFTLGENDKFRMEVTERNGDLLINEKPVNFEGPNINIGSVDEDYTITIEAPRGVSLNIEGDDDTYEINNIDGEITMDTDDSDITLRSCQGNRFRFDFDDGQLMMDEGAGELRLNFDDGSADIRNGDFSYVNVDTDDGSVTMATVLAEDGDYQFATDDGRVDFSVLGGGGEFSVEHDEIKVYAGSSYEELRDDENYSEYRLQGGNAKVHIETDDGEVRLDTQ